MIVILDFGAQYARLIARRIREQEVYCEILPYSTSWKEISSRNPQGIILSGGPASVYDDGAPRCTAQVFTCGIPLLGICYGLQLIVRELGGSIVPASRREYGQSSLHVIDPCGLFSNLPSEFPVWMSHGDRVERLPTGFRSLATSVNSPHAAVGNDDGLTGIQFHPEVAHTPLGRQILKNFLFEVCKAEPSWRAENFVDEAIRTIREQVGAERVVCALSGGVDSTVVATLLARAIGRQLTCVFVDTGLLRYREAEKMMETFREDLDLPVVRVDAQDRFLARLIGVKDPEQKRHAIGHEFIRVFTDEARKVGDVKFLAQGTLYPDVIESTSHDTHGVAKIKSHHNVGGLPEDLHFELVEPLRYLFKDEVRALGIELGIPERIVHKQPFPGPGLAVRVIGEVTEERLDLLRLCDEIVTEEIERADWSNKVWQAFAILTPVQSVGVMGDGRTYANLVAIRAVTSEDAMTADWARLPHDLLARISTRIVNEVSNVNRVVYDITTKPPATIEWE